MTAFMGLEVVVSGLIDSPGLLRTLLLTHLTGTWEGKRRVTEIQTREGSFDDKIYRSDP